MQRSLNQWSLSIRSGLKCGDVDGVVRDYRHFQVGDWADIYCSKDSRSMSKVLEGSLSQVRAEQFAAERKVQEWNSPIWLGTRSFGPE